MEVVMDAGHHTKSSSCNLSTGLDTQQKCPKTGSWNVVGGVDGILYMSIYIYIDLYIHLLYIYIYN